MRASFFDWDGTLTDLKKGFLMIDFSKHLASKNLFSKESYFKMEEFKNLYSKGKLSYREAIGKIPRAYSIALKGISEHDIKREAEIFADKVIKGYLQPYTKNLVDLMNGYGMTIGISGAPKELVVSLGNRLNFDLSFGSEVEIKNGICIGVLKHNLVMKEAKEVVLEKVTKENDIDLSESFGFGDTEQDLAFLSKVRNQVALNPNHKLLTIAKNNRWLIFNSSDDVISEISKKLKNYDYSRIRNKG